ncbi:MAG: nuclear transport factor 2 family protein [Bacteroidota bacterium]
MKKLYIPFLLGVLILIGCLNYVTAQNSYAEDVASQDAIITALYASISGEKGEARDWDRFRNLFTDDARLIPTQKDENGTYALTILSPDGYIERAGAYLENEGFFEKEIHRVSEEFGSLVHVWSTYEGRKSSSDSEPFVRGVNSIQLLYDGKRWYVLHIYWLAESEENPLPSTYLPE